MDNYQDFVNASVENYQKLPQETNELYKRHHIHIPFDLKSFHENKDNKVSAKDKMWNLSAKLGIKFDTVMGSSDFLNTSDFVRIVEDCHDFHSEGILSGKDDKYVSFINAYPGRSIVIEVPEGKSASINAMILNSNVPLNSKIFIKLAKGSKLNMLEYYCSASDVPTSLGSIHDIILEDNAELELNSLHNEDGNTLVLSHCNNKMGKDSHLRYNSLYNGSAHTRVRNMIDANGEHGRVYVSELIFGSKMQKFDVSTQIVNNAAHTNASLESKTALMDQSFCIMKGYAKINKGATKARSYVHERGILLDKNAKVDGLPDMSVDENDVKATHSSATAPVDPESVFYLMSKGIGILGVRKLLVTGFFAENLSRIQNNLMSELSMSLINAKLEDKSFGLDPKMDTRNMWVGPSASSESDMFKGHYKYRGE